MRKDKTLVRKLDRISSEVGHNSSREANCHPACQKIIWYLWNQRFIALNIILNHIFTLNFLKMHFNIIHFYTKSFLKLHKTVLLQDNERAFYVIPRSYCLSSNGSVIKPLFRVYNIKVQIQRKCNNKYRDCYFIQFRIELKISYSIKRKF